MFLYEFIDEMHISSMNCMFLFILRKKNIDKIHISSMKCTMPELSVILILKTIVKKITKQCQLQQLK